MLLLFSFFIYSLSGLFLISSISLPSYLSIELSVTRYLFVSFHQIIMIMYFSPSLHFLSFLPFFPLSLPFYLLIDLSIKMYLSICLSTYIYVFLSEVRDNVIASLFPYLIPFLLSSILPALLFFVCL